MERNANGLRPASYWEAKAEEARTCDENMHDPTARATLERVALAYENMAREARKRENVQKAT